MNVEKIITTLKGRRLIPYAYWSRSKDCGCAVGTLLEAAGVERDELAKAAEEGLTPNMFNVLKQEYGISSFDFRFIEGANDYPSKDSERLRSVAERIGGEEYL